MLEESLNIFFTPFWSGLILFLLFLALVAYLIKKWRCLDLRQLIRRNLIFAVLMVIIIGIYIFIITLLANLASGLTLARPSIAKGALNPAAQMLSGANRWVGGLSDVQVMVMAGAIMFLLAAIGLEPLKKYLQQITDRFLFKKDYQPQELLARLADIANTTLDSNVLLKSTADQLARAFHTEDLAIMLADKKTGDFILAAKKDYNLPLGHRLPKNDPLVEYYHSQKAITVLKALKHSVKNAKQLAKDNWLKSVQEVIDSLELLEAAVVVPIYSQTDLTGFFLLGYKKSGDDYMANDLKVLEAIADQTAIALAKTQLYGELKEFNQTLKDKVAVATADLRAANQRLSELDRIKSDFISIASHKLRTPLTIIKGYVSMILDGSFGRVPKAQKEAMEKVYVSNERLVRLVDNLLDVYHLDSDRMQFNFQSVILTDIVQSVISELNQGLAKKGLDCQFNQPKEPLPAVWADEQKIREVVINLIDNAIKYTQQGSIKVKLELVGHDVVFSCADTGVGISPDDLGQLFQKFSRAPGISLIDTESTGLGLYVARCIIQKHHGRIWAESAGEGLGSRFSFALPRNNRQS
ncbi:MAG: GAF domain-containing sensor histidine kinase [bacterium]